MITLMTLLACGDKDNADSGSTDSAAAVDDSSEPEAFAPTWGAWTSVDGETTDDTCNFEDDGGDSGPSGSALTLADGGDGTFTISVNVEDSVTTFTCTLTDQSFACDAQILLEEDFTDFELDATLTGTSEPNGEFSDANTMSAEQVVSVECAGADCATVTEFSGVTFPCGFTLALTATADAAE